MMAYKGPLGGNIKELGSDDAAVIVTPSRKYAFFATPLHEE
jgi:hypothetical protein